MNVKLGCYRHSGRHCLLVAMALLSSTMSWGKEASNPVYTDVAGRKHWLPGSGECRALALIFVAHQCPMANAYAPEIGRLCKEYSKQGIAFRVVYSERDLNFAEAARHAKEYAYPCPAILDRELRLATRFGATITPQAALISPSGDVLYLGRIDDIYADYGKRRARPQNRDLRNAIEDTLAARAVVRPKTPALGCRIDFELPQAGKK